MDRPQTSTQRPPIHLKGGRWMPGPGIARSTLEICKMSWKKRAGRVIFSSISHRVTSPGAIAGVRRGESATYVEPERTSGRRRTYFQTWPLLCLETTPVLPCPFATNQLSPRAIRKTYRTKPLLSVFRHSR